MNRLPSELHRLYSPASPAGAENDASSPVLIDSLDRVRAMVLSLTRPASWEALSKVWKGVQTEFDLPAPAIAVSGTDSLQLWFSLAEPVTVPQAHAFLESLRVRFLPEVKAGRVGLWPALEASAQRQELHARVVPARQEASGNWSAFVAADLAPVFDDTPWLDIPPSEEGQAALLRGLVSMTRAAFEAALERGSKVHLPSRSAGDSFGGAPDVASSKKLQAQDRLEPTTRKSAADSPAPTRGASDLDATLTGGRDAMNFLLRIMNDDTVALSLRIDAAKALLPYSNDHR